MNGTTSTTIGSVDRATAVLRLFVDASGPSLGITEIAEGTVAGVVLEVASTVVGLTTTAGPVTNLRRRIEVRGDEMTNETHMAMRDVPLMSHVRARLGRVTPA